MQNSPTARALRAAAAPSAGGAWLLAAALFALLAWDASGLDLRIMHRVGDADGFALRHAWFTKAVIHEGGRLVASLAMAFLVVLNFWPRLLPRLRLRERRWWLATTLACLVVISLVKRVSLTSCPWDLAEFGGTALYVSHWTFGVYDGGGGHCFPSGHASAAFAFLAGGWAMARAYPRAARAWWMATVLLGIVYGLGQMLRGAHYPSHMLWTGWICWAVTAAAASFGPWRFRRRASFS